MTTVTTIIIISLAAVALLLACGLVALEVFDQSATTRKLWSRVIEGAVRAHLDHQRLVATGAVETPLLRSNFPEKVIPPERALPPERIAEVVVDCIEGRRDDESGRTIPMPSP